MLDDVGPVVRPAYDSSSVVVSRRAIEMAFGESHRPNQTMANAAKRGLKLASRHENVDEGVVMVAERVAGREILSVEEISMLEGVFKRCLEAKNAGQWAGSPAWIEWQLAGGDSGLKWVQRRSQSAAVPAADMPATAPQSEPRAAEVSLRPTAGMASACRRGLKLYEEGRGGDGLVAETISWAKKIAARESLTKEKVVKMAAWHARHKVDRRPGWDKAGEESPGFVANLLWAGPAGMRWSQAKVAELRRAGEVRDMEDIGDDYETGLDERSLATAEAYEAICEDMGPWGQGEAQYREKSDMGSVRCDNCVFFRDGGACEIVQGDIATGGVCKLNVIHESETNDMADDKSEVREQAAVAEAPAQEMQQTEHQASAPPEPDYLGLVAALQAASLKSHLHGDSSAS